MNASKFFGYNFKGRSEDNDVIIWTSGGELRYRLLNVIEFTSARKRMSVIVRSPDGKIRIMCKGADSIIIPLLHPQTQYVNETQSYLDDFSKEGLRTLIIAEKEISENEYYQWNEMYKQALVATSGREEKIGEVAELIEKNLELIGSTAIEDIL